MRKNRLTAVIIWVSLWVIFASVCLYYFLLLPVRTATLVGSSAHWKAEDIVQVQILDKGWHASSFDDLTMWWTGTPGGVTDVKFQLAGLHGVIEEGDESGPFNPWKIHNTDVLISEPQLEYGLVLTITWKDGTETLHLQRH